MTFETLVNLLDSSNPKVRFSICLTLFNLVTSFIQIDFARYAKDDRSDIISFKPLILRGNPRNTTRSHLHFHSTVISCLIYFKGKKCWPPNKEKSGVCNEFNYRCFGCFHNKTKGLINPLCSNFSMNLNFYFSFKLFSHKLKTI